MDAYIDHWYSTSYKTRGFYELRRLDMDDLIDYAYAVLGQR